MKQYTGVKLKDQTVDKISKHEQYTRSFLDFSKYHQLPNTGNAQMSLSQLSSLLTGDDTIAQFDIIEGKVNSFLTDTQVGFLNVGKLYDDIVVGCVVGEYDSDMYNNYQTFIDEQLASQIELLEDEGCNEYMLTIAGRHRCVGLITICDLLGINPSDVVLSVLVKTYETWEDAALAVLCANKSRSMTPAERTNCIVNSQQVNTMSITDLANHASQGIKNAKEAFALAACNLGQTSLKALTRNTVSNVAKSFITNVGKTKDGKKTISYLSDEKVLNALVVVFMKALEQESVYSNVARNASKIGATIATNYLNRTDEIENKPSEGDSPEVIDSFNTDAF